MKNSKFVSTQTLSRAGCTGEWDGFNHYRYTSSDLEHCGDI